MYEMMNFVNTLGEHLGEFLKAADFFAAVYLLDWSEEGFIGRDKLFHHCGRWRDGMGGSDVLHIDLMGGWS